MARLWKVTTGVVAVAECHFNSKAKEMTTLSE